MLILTWVGIIFVIILHVARCKIMTNIMPTHVKITIEPGIRELFLKQSLTLKTYIHLACGSVNITFFRLINPDSNLFQCQ
jgi:hypothetical protein